MSLIPNWKIMSDISDEDENNQFIKTGYTAIDANTQGLILGGTSIISGTNGSAKSTVVGQIALNIINSKQAKVGIFSGELTDKRFKRWLYLQASGKKYNTKKTDENGKEIDFYQTPKKYFSKINEWISDKLYLYDNAIGFKIEDVGNNIVKLLQADSGVKLIFIDNLFVLDINKLSEQKYEAQRQLVIKMCAVAKKYNVHICFIMHPTKVKTLIRKEDISGSSDLSNATDYVFILHRNTTDFKVRAKEFFGWTDTHPIFEYDNICEIAKDRENGSMEKLIGFYFEKESKRLLNYKTEYTKYGWEDLYQQTAFEKLPTKLNELKECEEDGELPF